LFDVLKEGAKLQYQKNLEKKRLEAIKSRKIVGGGDLGC
jgi:hypothetical protein